MTANEILEELKSMGSERYKKMLLKNHGVQEPCFGVKIGDMKKIQKRVKKDYRLALDLYDTGNYDAMYLAGLIADDARMSKTDLRRWVKNACSGALSGATVPWVAAQGRHGHDLALEWIESDKPSIAAAGWSTLSCLTALKPDEELDIAELRRLTRRVQKTIHQSADAVRYQMNMFLISVGCYVKSLTQTAIQIGEKIGKISADLGDNDCQFFYAPDYIRKVEKRGSIGRKRKTVKC